jgi:tetratricopeptide (TPR) repeat protein
VALAEEVEPQLSAWQDWGEAFRRLDAEADNLGAAMRWSLANDAPEIALRIGGAIREWMWARPHRRQFQEWLRRALEMGGAVAPGHRARALGTLALPVWGGGQVYEALELGEEALALAEETGESRLVTRALYDVGRAAHGAGQHKRARAYFERCLAIAREQDDRVSTSEASIWLAMCHEPEERRVLLAELLPEVPYILGADVLLELGWTNLGLGNFPEAGVWFQGSFERWGEAGILPAQAHASQGLAGVNFLLGHNDRALRHLEQCQELGRRSGNRNWILVGARLHGELAWRRGDLETAARWLQEALDLAQERGSIATIAHVQRWRAYVLCSQGDFDQAEAVGTASLEGFDEANDFGRGIASLALARVALFRGEADHAVELFRAALRRLSTQETWMDTIRALEGLGWALAEVGLHREAAVLLGFVDGQRQAVRMVRPAVDRPYHEGVVADLRAALGEDVFAAAWAEGEGLTLEVVRSSQVNDT